MLLHAFKKKRIGKKALLALKLDTSKAYDRVEWPFIDKILIQMGFARMWVVFILKCVNLVSYAIIVNGEVGNTFTPSRGLR